MSKVELKGEWQLQPTGYMSVVNIQQTRDSYYNSFKDTSNYGNLHVNQPRQYEAFQDVIKKSGKQPYSVTIEEFYDYFPELLLEDESHLSTKINEIFVKYRLDEIGLLAKGYSELAVNAIPSPNDI